MNYRSKNKEAWEEAFDHRANGWGKDIIERLHKEPFPFIEKVLIEEIKDYNFKSKIIGQFCCNNGRELLSLMKLGAAKGVGFDIAENMIQTANATVKELDMNCSFIATDILEMDSVYYDKFDYLFITIGALTWFQDLSRFFYIVSLCLKKGGKLIINEMHPVTNMLGTYGEEIYDEINPNKLVYSYFRKEPWIENSGIGYISGKTYDSKTFISFSHSFSDIINSIINNHMNIRKMKEYDYDISELFGHLDHTGIPLSYVLVSEKQES